MWRRIWRPTYGAIFFRQSASGRAVLLVISLPSCLHLLCQQVHAYIWLETYLILTFQKFSNIIKSKLDIIYVADLNLFVIRSGWVAGSGARAAIQRAVGQGCPRAAGDRPGRHQLVARGDGQARFPFICSLEQIGRRLSPRFCHAGHMGRVRPRQHPPEGAGWEP